MKVNSSDLKVQFLNGDQGDHLHELIRLFEVVFENRVTPQTKEYYESLLNNTSFKVWVILHQNRVLGGVTVHELPNYYRGKPDWFLYDVAVHPKFQRMGLGKCLLQKVQEEAFVNDVHEVFVFASADEDQAVNFYQKLEGAQEAVVAFTFVPLGN